MSSNESDYLVKNPKLVIGLLTDVINKKSILTAYFGEDNASFLTTIVDLDPKKKLLALDYGPKDYLNQALLTSNKVLFRTEMDGVKMSFAGKSIKSGKYDGSSVFLMPIPEAVFWMQRRQFYRIKVPISHNCHCKLYFLNSSTEQIENYQFKLLDLSATGFSFYNDNPKLRDRLLPEETTLDCHLSLHDGHHGSVSVVIKNNTDVRQGNSTVMLQRVGCQIVEITSLLETHIQRYMQEIELQIRNLGQ